MEGLNCAFMGLINPGEEVILFDPSFSGYRIYIQMAGGKAIGIPLIPRYNVLLIGLSKRRLNFLPRLKPESIQMKKISGILISRPYRNLLMKRQRSC